MRFTPNIQKQPMNITYPWSFKMKEHVKFDWYDYYLLAESFQTENPAKLRTGINRYYYSVF